MGSPALMVALAHLGRIAEAANALAEWQLKLDRVREGWRSAGLVGAWYKQAADAINLASGDGALKAAHLPDAADRGRRVPAVLERSAPPSARSGPEPPSCHVGAARMNGRS